MGPCKSESFLHMAHGGAPNFSFCSKINMASFDERCYLETEIAYY
jgi:hypothetical protein